MTIDDRIVDNELYDSIADREEFKILDIHTTQVPSGTCADLGRSADGVFYVRAYTSQADRSERQRAYAYQSDEGQRAALHFQAIRDADVERQCRIEDLAAQLDAERKCPVNPGAVDEMVDRHYGFLESIRHCNEAPITQQISGRDLVRSTSPSTWLMKDEIARRNTMQRNRGIVGDYYGYGPGSGLASVEINRPDGTHFTVDGDWRMIQSIAENLAGQEVVVVDDEHGERVIPADDYDDEYEGEEQPSTPEQTEINRLVDNRAAIRKAVFA